MSKQSMKMVYAVILVIGVALIVWGFNDHGAFGNKLARSLSGKTSDKVLLLWISGGVVSLVGLFGLLRGK